MATTAFSFESRENVSKAGKQFKFDAQEKTQRRTLQTIQYSSVKENRLVGKGTMKDGNGKSRKKIKPSNERVKVFEDEKEAESSKLEERGTQTSDSPSEADELAEADREALQLMGGDVAPEQYWKLLAEERRQALNDTLEENEQLHREVDSLREENEKLTEIASQAEYLSSFLQGVVSSDDEDNDSVDDEDYKTGDEQLGDEDKPVTVEDSDSDNSVYAAAPSNLVARSTNSDNTSADYESDFSDSSQSGEASRLQSQQTSVKNNLKRFSGDWVNVELDDEKVASTEIIQAEVLASLKEEDSS